MSKKQRLELTWIGKDNRQHLEPRILIEDQSKSHHAKHRLTDSDLFDNRLQLVASFPKHSNLSARLSRTGFPVREGRSDRVQIF
jgi:hypothetical protein